MDEWKKQWIHLVILICEELEHYHNKVNEMGSFSMLSCTVRLEFVHLCFVWEVDDGE